MFGELILKDCDNVSMLLDNDMFHEHGYMYQIGAEDLRPPTTTCLNTECAGRHLIDERKSECQLFTLHWGILPIWATSLYCKNSYRYQSISILLLTNPLLFNHYLGCSASAQSISHSMDGELILDAFFLHALLRNHTRQAFCLTLLHNGGHNDHFTNALNERNFCITGTGQEMWGHACNDCAKMYTGQDGKIYHMTAGVTDGITVDHLCCWVHDCKVPLQHHHHRFCPTHHHLNDQCCVKGCSSTVELGHQTCTVQFGWAWTHNKQLFVQCCGVITYQATFYGSKGIAGVKDFLKASFPSHYPGSMPSYIFYDNNCWLLTDVVCQMHCNPARFQKLVGDTDTSSGWIFNSSAAEQANVWFGKFASNVWEMLPAQYNFYLDEMIVICNRWIVSELCCKQKVPHIMPEEILSGEVA
ncbi:hypothetical protein K439DRAFT_1648182 [Ramaria rubella]|nr:hypothetical protein K439DRAFT_1648182 [Ramaria rubella]